MVKVCLLNSATNVVENIIEVDDINNVPDFAIGEGQVVAPNHDAEIGDIWNGSSYTLSEHRQPMSEEQRWKDIRRNRNFLLAETDWMASGDRTISTEWANYRQALRDLPQTYTDSIEAINNFPQKPSS